MAWTTIDLKNLEDAIASGAKRVRYQTEEGEREVQYRSSADMIALRRLMRIELGLTDRKDRVSLGNFSKGLGTPPNSGGII
jgi:hypothetical protein